MDSVEVSTVIYLSPEDVYEFLLDFPNYGSYSEHLRDVRQFGDGDPGTEYELDFVWWKLGYTARSRVVDVEPPNRIDWRVVKDVDAVGRWSIEAIDGAEAKSNAGGDPPAKYRLGDDRPASRVTMYVRYRPESAASEQLDIPMFVPFDRVVRKVKPKLRSEAEQVVRRIVADLEGEPREVELQIETS